MGLEIATLLEPEYERQVRPPGLMWVQVLGTPSREEILDMNPNYTEFKFPQIKAHPWSKVFSKRLPPDAIELVRRFTFPPSTFTDLAHFRRLSGLLRIMLQPAPTTASCND